MVCWKMDHLSVILLSEPPLIGDVPLLLDYPRVHPMKSHGKPPFSHGFPMFFPPGFKVTQLAGKSNQKLANSAWTHGRRLGDTWQSISITAGGRSWIPIQCLGGSQGARAIHIPFSFPINWGAKELLGVSQLSIRYSQSKCLSIYSKK